MSDLVTNDSLTKAVQAALNPEEIRAAIVTEAQNQGLVRDASGAFVADTAKNAAPAPAPAPSQAVVVPTDEPTFKRTELINGREFEFEAESELELERMVNTAFKTAYALQTPSGQEDEVVEEVQVDPAKEAALRAELEIKFKNGEVTAKDYLEQSGAINEYLAEQGVPVEQLRNTIEQANDAKFTQSWEQATQEFLTSSYGADWPGGEKNRNLIGLKIAELGLVDATDKVAALAQAYQSMKQTGMIFYEAPAPTQTAQTSHVPVTPAAPAAPQYQPQTAYTAPAAPVQPARQQASSVFGASSGTSANNQRDASAAPNAVSIPATASPQEILEAWKASLQAAGVDPNEAFRETFRGRR